MDVKEVIFSAIKELVLPEINVLKEKQDKLGERIKSVDQRLTDMNAHLLDQSRRIDSVRDELSGQITAVREELLGRIDGVREELSGRRQFREQTLGTDRRNKRKIGQPLRSHCAERRT